MEKGFWGPSTWYMLHCVATGYKPEYKISYKQFIHSLPDLLPCKYCRQHLLEEYMVLPLNEKVFINSKTFFLWTFFLHDYVNKRLKKQSPNYTSIEYHYFSNLGNNKFWGPAFWKTIHCFAATYRPSVKQSFKQFIYSLTGIIPCEHCREQFQKHLKRLPLTDDYLLNNHNLFLWSYLLHDLVNKQIGKTSPPFEIIKNQYFNDKICDSCKSN